MNVRKGIISICEKNFLRANLVEHTRLDGRAFDEFRQLEIEYGKDWGCCYVSLGKTKVLGQVSCEIQQPKSTRPSEGILNINLELNPMADPHFESGRNSELSVQLNRLLEKCLKDSKAVDLESLCIKMKEKVWGIRVDLNVLNHDGNILDCASIAALASLAHFRRPDVTCDGEEFVIHSVKQRDPISMVIHHYPVCVTYSVFTEVSAILADPNLLEEEVSDAFLSIGVNPYKELCGLHLGGKADLTSDLILSTASKAAARAAVVVQQIKDAIEKDNQLRKARVEQGFQKLVQADVFKKDSVDTLKECLDNWATKTTKSKRKKIKEKDFNKDIYMKNEKFTAEVEVLGKQTAALIPTESSSEFGSKACEVWQATDDSEDDDEVVVVEVPKPVVETVDINDSDSEEEAVVILNADSKTKKHKNKFYKH